MQNKQLTIYISTYDDIKNPHYGGGGAIAVHEVAKRLALHHTVRVLSWNYSGKAKEVIDGVKYERFGISFLSPKFAMFVYQLWLPYIAKQKQFDVWLESFCPPFTTAFLPRSIKKPVIGIVHMLAAEDMERKYKLPFYLIQNRGLKLYNRMIVTSKEMKEKILSINSSSTVTVISNGVDKVMTEISQKRNYVLFLGRIEIDQKGIDLLLNAFQQFHEMHKQFKLVIAGTGDAKEIEQMKSLIEQNSLKDSIILKGKVSGKEKETLLKHANCVVIPSRFETYSLVALEALAHGTPVVCFAINGLSWLPNTVAIKVTPFNVEGLVKAITILVSNKTFADTMSKEGIAYAKHFTWDSIAKQYNDYLKREITV